MKNIEKLVDRLGKGLVDDINSLKPFWMFSAHRELQRKLKLCVDELVSVSREIQYLTNSR